MLNDIFMEDIVKHKKTGKDSLLIAGTVLLAVILCLVVMLFAAYLFGMWLLLIAGIIYGAYLLIRSRKVEYEYILTNSELDIDKIIAKSRRKRICTIDFKDIERCAPITTEKYRFEYQNAQGIELTRDCSGDGSTPVYFVDFHGDEKRQRILFQPKRRMIEAARKFNPRCIELAEEDTQA